MDDRQMRQVLANHAARGPQPVFSEQRVGGVLQRAAQALRDHEALATAWLEIAEPQWLAETEIVEVHPDVVVIAVASPTLLHHLTQQRDALRREITRRVRTARRLRFVPATTDDNE